MTYVGIIGIVELLIKDPEDIEAREVGRFRNLEVEKRVPTTKI